MIGDARAMGDSLRGLALGDGFGERWFHYGNQQAASMIRDQRTPTEAPFYYTDDTSLALSIAWALNSEGRIDQQDLAKLFAEEFLADPMRGYGYGCGGWLSFPDRGPISATGQSSPRHIPASDRPAQPDQAPGSSAP